MNRRGFIKTILAGTAALTLPACRRPEPEFMVDMAKPGADETVKSKIFFESTPSGENFFYSKVEDPNSWGDPCWDNIEHAQDLMNKLRNKQLDNMRMVVMTCRKHGLTHAMKALNGST